MNPLTRLKPGNVRLDVRHRRGELSVDEVAKLLIVTKEQKPFRRIDGPNRVMIYSIALGTGFRLSELASLTPRHFNLDATPPVIVLHAGDSKNRQGATQPIAQWLADELKTFLQGRAPETKLWPGTWSDRGADMLRLDLEAADIAREVDSPDGTEIRDFPFAPKYIHQWGDSFRCRSETSNDLGPAFRPTLDDCAIRSNQTPRLRHGGRSAARR